MTKLREMKQQMLMGRIPVYLKKSFANLLEK